MGRNHGFLPKIKPLRAKNDFWVLKIFVIFSERKICKTGTNFIRSTDSIGANYSLIFSFRIARFFSSLNCKLFVNEAIFGVFFCFLAQSHHFSAYARTPPRVQKAASHSLDGFLPYYIRAHARSALTCPSFHIAGWCRGHGIRAFRSSRSARPHHCAAQPCKHPYSRRRYRRYARDCWQATPRKRRAHARSFPPMRRYGSKATSVPPMPRRPISIARTRCGVHIHDPMRRVAEHDRAPILLQHTLKKQRKLHCSLPFLFPYYSTRGAFLQFLPLY